MAGFWQNLGNANTSNLSLLINEAIQAGNRVISAGGNLNQQFVSQSTSPACNDVQSARSYLAASLPVRKPSFRQSPNIPVKTTSIITLPPSLVNRRQGKSTQNSSSSSALSSSQVKDDALPEFIEAAATTSQNCPPATRNPYVVNNALSGASSKGFVSNSSVAPSSTGVSVFESTDSTNPVFSTEIGKGKQPLPTPKLDESRYVVLDPLKPQQKLLTYNAQRMLYDNDYWHKFIIVGGVKMEREKVLKRILEACEPTLMLPVLYQEEGEDTSFYARNCGSAIEKLCRNYHLCFDLDGSQFYVRVHLQCAPVNRLRVNALTLLRRVLEKRWKKDERLLDLSDFQHDSDLDSFMYCPLSQPSVLHYVLLTAINTPLNFSTLILSHNGIRQLKLELLVKASYFHTLDLSHNELLYQTDLHDLKELHSVKKLVLDGNPLCSEFRTSESYISTLKSIMPQLISLDHVPLFSGAISVAKEQNFLCSKAGYSLVDQFLKHFFNRYDWSDRRCLDGLYHGNALFSLTCFHIPGQSTSDSNKLTWYMSYNRNLMKLCDYSKAEKLIFHGPSQILDLFCSLPASEHDPYSFCVDLIHYNDKVAVVSVSGVFREHPTLPPDPDSMRAFRRVFSLCCISQNEWQITNEQLHISNPTNRQVESAFKTRRPPIEAPVAAWLVQDAQLLTEEEKDQMSNIMMQITTLNKHWATRFLDDHHWYVREALIAFVNQYESKSLPEEAFAPSLS